MSKKDKTDHESRKHKKRSRSRSLEKSPKSKHSKRNKEKRKRDIEERSSPQQSGSTSSLSIEETNKLRAKLGLAPLDIGTEKKPDDGTAQIRNSDEDFVHVPAKNISEIRRTEKIQEKLRTMREKRELMEKLREAQPLSLGEEVNTLSWVEKMRLKEKERRAAEEREKLLSEMDEEFGVSQLVQAKISAPKEYASRDLEGLKVEHKADRLIESGPIILTLKDKGVLDEDEGDVLVNVNIIDDEKAEKNRENKRKTAGLGGILQDEDEDVIMGLRAKGVLEKYDAEIDGPKKQEFVLGAGGSYSSEHELALRRLQQELQSSAHSANDYEVRVASEYFSAAEMEQFRKRKRKTKVQRRKLTADDLISASFNEPLVNGAGGSGRSRDHGSRRRGALTAEEEPEEGEVHDSEAKRVDRTGKTEEEEEDRKSSTTALTTETGLNPTIAALLEARTVSEEVEDRDTLNHDWDDEVVEPDDLQLDLERTLERVRRSNLTKPVRPEETIRHAIDGIQNLTKPEQTAGGLVFDSTEEFFKQVTAGLQNANQAKFNQASFPNQKPEGGDDDDVKTNLVTGIQDSDSEERSKKSKRSSTKSYSRDPTATTSGASGKSWPIRPEGSSSQFKEESDPDSTVRGVLDDEPELNQGVYSALLLAQKKGYVDTQNEATHTVNKLVNLMAKHYVQEDVRYDDIDAKFSKRERYSGPLSEFREKSSYKPEVQLHYVDDMGRALAPKEAFRQLSHKFHGKGSGKKKIEKRTKKIMEEALLRNAQSSDTPLGTTEKLNKKLKSQGMPYVVLSGKNAASKSLMK
uniref:U4/U6.U5 tri-snRNP-associated protein 1 n=1 Tax=Schistocephalus solidus TaxID=70667 RepID=A0A0X3NFR3_SCHSO